MGQLRSGVLVAFEKFTGAKDRLRPYIWSAFAARKGCLGRVEKDFGGIVRNGT